MAEIIITPQSTGDIEVGGFIDDKGDRFVGMSFKMNNGDHTVVTLTVPLFKAFAAHLAHAAAQIATENYWRDIPR